MTEKQLINLRLYVEYNKSNLYEWFKVEKFSDIYIIESGLKHVNPNVLSPYHYKSLHKGKNSKKEALTQFKEWYIKKIKL